MSEEEKSPPPRKWINVYAWIAVGLGVLGLVCLGFSIQRYRSVMFAEQYSPDPQHWGYFGDFVGGFAGTLIALLTLVALAIAIWIQGTELTETRDQLRRTADAATRQLTLTRIYESRRIQPMIKAEWHRYDAWSIGLDITNVGLGPAILDTIEFKPAGQAISHAATDYNAAKLQWRDAIKASLGETYPGDHAIRVTNVNESMRVLAMNEKQSAVAIEFPNQEKMGVALRKLSASVRPIVHFHSLAGRQLTTETQIAVLEEPDVSA